MENQAKTYDVVIIGGGAAGLSAAQALGRARRSVLVVDAGEPRNAPADAMHNYLSRDGMNPLELLAAGRAELAKYGVDIVADRATDSFRTETGFTVSLARNPQVSARRIILAGGLKDLLPEIDGLAEHWGNDVLHCPYCHGWEVKDQHIGIVDSAFSVHQALMFTQWSKNITLFRAPDRELGSEDLEQLEARGVGIIEADIAAVRGSAGSIQGVELSDGTVYPLDALVIMPGVEVDLSGVASLGLTASEHPMGVGQFVEADAMGQSGVPGVWVAGSLADPKQQVIMAAASGLGVGAAVNADLTREETERDVAELRLQRAAL
ncbi:NAD(P)/FAD-dependent oxidoreductase [Paeniglutamicibacter kerguelensis]|uniref:Thioredoxin reductase n=1 Tax=Paeniglutamicibacter kerguelensis TaxID=254788 RepID=A0ABS4XCK6_9MICC|nr:NAD(P)/FAD-dependent oxidoreductase [Paeniglutamicibacter kerguelensis]MBP2386190.1 thioredoxin reductase [Paeniglutamicibacter kerguelensis]